LPAFVAGLLAGALLRAIACISIPVDRLHAVRQCRRFHSIQTAATLPSNLNHLVRSSQRATTGVGATRQALPVQPRQNQPVFLRQN
jgi:hypothetical protein